MWPIIAVFALPLISLLGGVASLYIDPKQEPKKKWILLALLLVSTTGSILGSISDDKAKTRSSQVILNMSSTIEAMSKKTVEIKDLLSQLTNSGINPETTHMIQQSLSADAARTRYLSTVQTAGNAKNITIAYFPKNVDGPVVINALREGGFQVETRTGNPANANLPTNAIWIGNSVSLEQAKFVALTLIRAGVGIAAIHRGFQNNVTSKANLIEIGSSQSLASTPPLTVDQVKELNETAIR